MELSGIEEAIAIAQARWPGFEFRAKNPTEACGPCPICGKAETDGFIIWDNGRFYCRPGGCEGWLDDNQEHTWTKEEIRLRRIEAELLRQKHKQEEHEKRLTALERMARCTDHLAYHDNLDEQSFGWWMEQGMEPVTILDYKLGYCPRCPTDREHRASYTIPIYDYSGKVLQNIRHRLENAIDGDKYRPHLSGLGTQLANAQILRGADYGLIVEGAKKAICVSQYGFPAVGVMGKRGVFKSEWLKWFPTGPIYIALDPDAQENADKLGAGLAKTGKDVYVASFPCKPDDWFVDGGTAAEFTAYLKWARKVH